MRKKAFPEAVFCLAFVLGCVALFFVETGFENDTFGRNIHVARACVLDVDNSDVRVNLIVKTGWQRLTCNVLSGPYDGTRMEVMNQLMGKMELDEVYTPGQTILIQYGVHAGKPQTGIARGHYRLRLELVLVLLFAGLLLLVAGWTGAKALLSFAFSGLLIWKVMLPLFLKGHNPIWIGLGVVTVLSAAISFLVGGLTKKGLTAFLGALLGLVLTCALSVGFSAGFRVHGAVRPFAETLLYSGFADLKLTPIFLSGIMVAASGAVMDLAMDIAAAMEEIKHKHPTIDWGDHVRSGLRVGRSVIGTMTTTLLLAYSGSYITMLMLFIAQGLPMPIILNLNYVAAEVLNTMVGSFGLVTVAPFTALVGGVIFHWRAVPKTKLAAAAGDR